MLAEEKTDLRTPYEDEPLLRVRRPSAILHFRESHGHKQIDQVACGDVHKRFVRTEDGKGCDARAHNAQVWESRLDEFLEGLQTIQYLY